MGRRLPASTNGKPTKHPNVGPWRIGAHDAHTSTAFAFVAVRSNDGRQRRVQASLDYPVRAQKNRWWDRDAECLRGIFVHHQLVSGRLLDG